MRRSDFDPEDVLCDRDVVLLALREAGPEGVHSHDLRRAGISGNPSERVRELRSLGHTITPKQESRGKGRRRQGVRFTLIHEAGFGGGYESDPSLTSAAESGLRGSGATAPPDAAAAPLPAGASAAESSDALFDLPPADPLRDGEAEAA